MKKKILIVVANYYKDISIDLIKSAKKSLPLVLKRNSDIMFVPGVFEIPVTIAKNIKKYDAFIALGCVIKGQTPHFNFISQATTNAIMKLSIDSKKPIGNGIITCLNMKQAIVRKKIKGREAAKAVISVLKNWKMTENEILQNPRVIVVQKLYGHYTNKESEISFPKHRYKKFIKDVVNGTIERRELINELMDKELKNDIDQYKTEILLKIMIMAAIYEFMFMHKTPIKVVINEYLKVSDFFLESTKKSFLNAILDKVSKVSRFKDV